MKIDERTAFILYTVLWVFFWNLADFIYSVCIMGGVYRIERTKSISLPVCAAAATGYIFYKIHNNSHEK